MQNPLKLQQNLLNLPWFQVLPTVSSVASKKEVSRILVVISKILSMGIVLPVMKKRDGRNLNFFEINSYALNALVKTSLVPTILKDLFVHMKAVKHNLNLKNLCRAKNFYSPKAVSFCFVKITPLKLKLDRQVAPTPLLL
jgi:hypothetical protein